MNNLRMIRTRLDNRERRARGHGLTERVRMPTQVSTDQKVGGSSPSERAHVFQAGQRWSPVVLFVLVVIWPHFGRIGVTGHASRRSA